MNKEAERLGISPETLESMKRFFLKHSIPLLIEERREAERVAQEAERDKQATS